MSTSFCVFAEEICLSDDEVRVVYGDAIDAHWAEVCPMIGGAFRLTVRYFDFNWIKDVWTVTNEETQRQQINGRLEATMAPRRPTIQHPPNGGLFLTADHALQLSIEVDDPGRPGRTIPDELEPEGRLFHKHSMFA